MQSLRPPGWLNEPSSASRVNLVMRYRSRPPTYTSWPSGLTAIAPGPCSPSALLNRSAQSETALFSAMQLFGKSWVSGSASRRIRA